MEEPTVIEKVAGCLLTETALTAIAAFAGVPIAALLPVLTNSLANGRHRKRVDAAIADINEIILSHSDKIQDLTDSHYQMINEVVLTILQTTQDGKIEFLKSVVRTNIVGESVPVSFVGQVSRILRDIAEDELLFLVKYDGHHRITLNDSSIKDNDLRIDPTSEEGAVFFGLV